MKININGEFEDKKEFEELRIKTRKLLGEFGFKNISCSEDLITKKWVFRCDTK